MQLPQGKWKQRMLTGGFLALFVAYAWLGSFALRPQTTLPVRAFAEALVMKDGARFRFENGALGNAILQARLRAVSLDALEVIDELGGFARPIQFMADRDEPTKYAVSGDRVELGVDWLKAEGQFGKALFKAWILQNAAAAISASAARVEVVSDLLQAMAQGELVLEDPRTRAVATYGPEATSSLSLPRKWPASIISLRRACDSGWAPGELFALCAANLASDVSGASRWADDASELTERVFVGGLAWRAYSRLSPFARLAMLRAWGGWLRAPVGERMGNRPTHLADWRPWLREEFEYVLPVTIYPGSHAVEMLALLERDSGLSDAGTLVLDYATRAPADSIARARPGGTPAFVGALIADDGAWLYPGAVKISRKDASSLRAREFIWESCDAPSLGEISAALQSKRLLFVQNCDGLYVDYKSYLRFGGDSFARANPKASFMQMHRPSVDYLLTKGLKHRADSVLSLVSEQDGVLAKSLPQKQNARLSPFENRAVSAW